MCFVYWYFVCRAWEARERRKAKEYEKEREKERLKEEEREREAKRLKEFLEDYDDERDDIKYYKSVVILNIIRCKIINVEMLGPENFKEG